MKISVVTVCYNAVAEIEATMLSVLNQTHTDVEYIVIDGGSTDGTVDIIRRYASRLAYWVSEPDGGIYDAMNKGISHATGLYINFMNAGDRFASGDVLEIVDKFAPKDRPAMVYGDVLYITDGKPVRRKPRPLNKFWQRTSICHQCVFITNVPSEIKYSGIYRLAGDHEVMCRLYYSCRWSMVYIPELPIAIYAGGGISEHNHKGIREFQKIAKSYVPAYKRIPYYLWMQFYERFSFGVRRFCGERVFGVVSGFKHMLISHK